MNGSNRKYMRILRVGAHQFGSLDAEIEFHPAHLTIVLGQNEAGKSTIVSALIAALFGINTRSPKRDPRPFAKYFRPWAEGEEFRVELDLEWNGEKLRVIRDFERGKFSVQDDKLRDRTREFIASRSDDRLGEIVTGGLSASAFLRSFIIEQEKAVLVGSPGDLVQKLQAMVTSSPGDTTAKSALDLIEQARREIVLEGFAKGAIKVETARKKLGDEVERLTARLEDLEEQERRTKQVFKELEEKENRKIELAVELEKVRKGILLTEKRDIETRLNKLHDNKQRAGELTRQLKELESERGFPMELEEAFVKPYGRFDEAKTAEKNAKEELRNRKAELDRELHTLEQYHDLKDFDPTVINELITHSLQWTEFDKRRAMEQMNLDEERAKLAAKGVSTKRLEESRKRIHKWPQDKVERFIEINRQLVDNMETRDHLMNHIDKSRRRFGILSERPLPIILFALFFGTSFGAFILWKLFEQLRIALFVSGTALIFLLAAIFEHIGNLIKLNSLKRQLANLNETIDLQNSKLKAIAAAINPADSIESIKTAIDDWKGAQGRCEEYFTIHALVDQAESDLERIGGRLRPYLERSAIIDTGADITRGDIEALKSRLEFFRQRIDGIDKLETYVKIQEEELEKSAQRVKELTNELAALFEPAGVPFIDDIEAATLQFRKKADRARQLKLVEEELEGLRESEIDESDVRESEKRLEDIRDQLKRVEEVDGQEGQIDGLRAIEQEIITETKGIEELINAVRLRSVKIIEDLPKDLQETRNELKLIEKKREALAIQSEALDLAEEVISEVGQQVYGGAAESLNLQLKPIMKRINPRWCDASFDDDLRLQATDSITGRLLESEEIERVLSAGARDSLFLSARLALSDFLAGGMVAAPHILDEPFAHLDDDRFHQGMSLLLERSLSGNQIILLTCHRKRHRDWFESIKPSDREKVAWIDLDEVSGDD